MASTRLRTRRMYDWRATIVNRRCRNVLSLLGPVSWEGARLSDLNQEPLMSSTILITGASTGFGRDAAERLARRGHRVYATMRDVGNRNARNRAALEKVARDEDIDLHVLELDVTREESVQRAVEAALDDAGHIDVVINNAGFAGIGVSEAYTPEQFLQMFDVNLFGVVRVNRAVLPSMRARRSGLLIHISSGAGRVTVPALAAYCA